MTSNQYATGPMTGAALLLRHVARGLRGTFYPLSFVLPDSRDDSNVVH